MANRDLVNHGAGKGDVPRTTFDDKWREKFSHIKGFNPKDRTGFQPIGGGKFRKTYR
jgi:hypothetical protein